MLIDNKPALVVLAAGIGSRYGGLKQMEPVGPHGEVVLDYSVYDALRAGFGKTVFVNSAAYSCYHPPPGTTTLPLLDTTTATTSH